MKAIIIDDEQKGRAVIKKMLATLNTSIEIIGEADSVNSGFELLSKTNPDIVFLDIRMEDGTGFDLLDQLEDFSFGIVFTTAYDEFAIKAFKYSAMDYLLKPIDVDELKNTVDKILKRHSNNNSENSRNIEKLLRSIQKQNKKIAVPSMNETLFIDEEDIIRCEGENNYTHIYLKSGKKITSTKTLKLVMNTLDPNIFFRVHNSSIINIKYIDKINHEGKVLLIDGVEVEVSRRRKKDFLDFFDKI